MTAFEVAVRSRNGEFARRNLVVVHGQAGGTAGLAKLKTGFFQHLVQTFGLDLAAVSEVCIGLDDENLEVLVIHAEGGHPGATLDEIDRREAGEKE